MRIGQLADSAGVTIQTVRFYERLGLISPPARRDSGYREFSTNAVEEIRTILQLKELGFTLAEIRAATAAHSDEELCRLAAEKVHALEAEIRRLTEILDALKRRRRTCGCDRQARFQLAQVQRK
jgi:DNA-binding transcriptional MerR regulator